MKSLFAMASLVVMLCGVGGPSLLIAQAANAGAAQASDAPTIHFDVVSIRPTKDLSVPRSQSTPANGDGMTFTNVPMGMAILYACHFNDPTLVTGLPEWTWSDRYDIAVKVSSEDVDAYHKLTSVQRSMMLLQVLEDRIKLQTHFAMKPVLVYDLVVAKGGPKMKGSTPGDTYPNGIHAGKVQAVYFMPPSHLVGQGATMAELAARMSDLGDWSLGRQVMDKTGLTGRYDFSLQWTADMKTDGDGDAGTPQRTDESGPTLFTAVQEQLGLKLDSVKEPVQSLVIEHAERPAGN